MVNFIICLLISVMVSYGMAILLVEKGKDFPVRRYRVILQKFIHDYIGWKWARVLWCTTCTSFWTTLITDLVVCVVAGLHGVSYFFWPFSGIVTAGIMWFIMEYLNAIDKEPNINVFVDNRGEQNEDLSINNNVDDFADL